MEFDLRPQEDWLHPLKPPQYEAFYFVFTSLDGRRFGSLRFLIGTEQVLELVAVADEGQHWGLHHRFPRSDLRVEGEKLRGPHLWMRRLEPWQRWEVGFEGTLHNAEDGRPRHLSMQATFEAEGPAARYRLGAYQQAEQEGWMEGTLRLGDADGLARCRFYRDHSWGVRDLGAVPNGWKVATAPGHFYLVYIDFGRPIVFGRLETAEGPRPLNRAEVRELEEGIVHYRFPEYGVEAKSQRIAEPMTAYLGRAGEEAFRRHPQEGDLLRDQLGPAIYTFGPGKEKITGFLEEARKL